MTRQGTALAWALLVATLALAVFTAAIVAISWREPLPDNWGFRGYWALTAVAFVVPGAIVTSGRPAHRVGWLLLIAGFVTALSGALQEYATLAVLLDPDALPAGPLAAWFGSWVWVLFFGALLSLLLLFPDGRLPSPRWRPLPWGIAVVVVSGIATFAFRPGPLENFVALDNPLAARGLLEDLRRILELIAIGPGAVLVLIACAASPLARIRRADRDQRQQLKWFAYVAAIMAAAFTFLIGSGVSKLGQLATLSAFSLVPIAVGIAVLRYRLYDIDVLINRTLVYGAVTAILVATYFAAVVTIQALLRPFTSGSELAVAGSTLLVVALFQPIRRRAQQAVDRRFYRSRYDAARTLDAFTARMRDQVDIDAVRRDVLDIVGTTVHPAHASVWLRGPSR